MATMALVLPEDVEKVLIGGDLAKLVPEQRVIFYSKVCESLGLNPLTKPFEYISLNGKTVLYARKDCTDQLRTIHNISIQIVSRESAEGCYVVTARAIRADGRHDESVGAVPIEGLKGEARSNAMMKCETKAKRRVTLSICGLGMLDESEVDSIPGSHAAQREMAQTRIAELKQIERPIPEELKLAVERMNENGTVAHTFKYLEDEFAQVGGKEKYTEITTAFRALHPKGTKIEPEAIKTCWLDLHAALVTLRAAMEPAEVVNA